MKMCIGIIINVFVNNVVLVKQQQTASGNTLNKYGHNLHILDQIKLKQCAQTLKLQYNYMFK